MTNSIWYSRFLVLAQMILIVLILSPVGQLWSGSYVRIMLICIVLLLAVALAVWALITMRIHNFSVMPEPKSGARLLSTGPYRHIRHPMYSAVILATAGACIAHQSGAKFVFLLALLVVLFLKIRREEGLLCKQFENYPSYRSETSALIPHVI